MGYYIIRNITNTLPKRHINKDKNLDITYNVGFNKKTYSLSVGDEMIFAATKTLPINIHTLRAKNLITVQEISENEFLRNQRPNAKKEDPLTPIKKTRKTTFKAKTIKEKKVVVKEVES